MHRNSEAHNIWCLHSSNSRSNGKTKQEGDNSNEVTLVAEEHKAASSVSEDRKLKKIFLKSTDLDRDQLKRRRSKVL